MYFDGDRALYSGVPAPIFGGETKSVRSPGGQSKVPAVVIVSVLWRVRGSPRDRYRGERLVFRASKFRITSFCAKQFCRIYL